MKKEAEHRELHFFPPSSSFILIFKYLASHTCARVYFFRICVCARVYVCGARFSTRFAIFIESHLPIVGNTCDTETENHFLILFNCRCLHKMRAQNTCTLIGTRHTLTLVRHHSRQDKYFWLFVIMLKFILSHRINKEGFVASITFTFFFTYDFSFNFGFPFASHPCDDAAAVVVRSFHSAPQKPFTHFSFTQNSMIRGKAQSTFYLFRNWKSKILCVCDLFTCFSPPHTQHPPPGVRSDPTQKGRNIGGIRIFTIQWPPTDAGM